MSLTKTKCLMCGRVDYLFKIGVLLLPIQTKRQQVKITFCLNDDTCFHDAVEFVKDNYEWWDDQ